MAPFYAARPGTLLWLTEPGRAGAARLAQRLREARVDGFAEGPALAAAVEAGLARGLPDDDKVISSAWVRYVQALKRPVAGVSFGDPALAPVPQSASSILAQALAAPSLEAHVDAAVRINPFYWALRSAALHKGLSDDPRVLASLDRLRLLPPRGRAILVDIANAELMTIEDGQVADRMKVIVGKTSAQTPLLAGTIHYVTFNPYWHIPQDVTRRTVAPIILKRGTSYLKLARYETVSQFGDGAEPVDPDSIDWKAVAAGEIEANVRQRAGGNNMMGRMKFGFVNDQGIFLHDTPHKGLFARAARTLSLGCVRLERPEALARWLLGREPELPGDGVEQLVQVDQGVPIYLLYLTARPDGEEIAFARDVYGLDRASLAPANIGSN
ncbi:MAG TPA: L,D-transpeptidase family protein [Sphingomicrobium sp.]|nr:L,D-transpeptidase family protein [Sphingomicrobium sp.]